VNTVHNLYFKVNRKLFASIEIFCHIVRTLAILCITFGFLLQLGRVDLVPAIGNEEKDLASFSPSQPREKWIKKRTSVKLKVEHRSKTSSSG
jgi:hypothetical protein